MPPSMRPSFMGGGVMYGQRANAPQNIIEKGPEIKKVSDQEGIFSLHISNLKLHPNEVVFVAFFNSMVCLH